MNNAWLYTNGVRVFVEKPTLALPEGKPGDDREAEFLIHNLSANPIHILGVTTSCGCISTDKLPATIPPQGIKALRLSLRLEESARENVEQTVTYHTDEPTAPNITVKVSGRLIDP